jgi:hypothetical protein
MMICRLLYIWMMLALCPYGVQARQGTLDLHRVERKFNLTNLKEYDDQYDFYFQYQRPEETAIRKTILQGTLYSTGEGCPQVKIFACRADNPQEVFESDIAIGGCAEIARQDVDYILDNIQVVGLAAGKLDLQLIESEYRTYRGEYESVAPVIDPSLYLFVLPVGLVIFLIFLARRMVKPIT